ncbi:MAG: hypothetical protein PVI30_19985, partial [Myxococcales bacterium]
MSARRAALTAECVSETTPDDGWVCSQSRTVECVDGSADPDVVYVEATPDAGTCTGALGVSPQGPYAVGSHEITVRDDNGAPVCTTELTVVDTQAPELVEHTINLWPPNHKLHDIHVGDCVSVHDACEPDLQGEFIWASSDEPINDIGDGNSEPDILFDACDHVRVRAERQGPRDGRVYRLGVRVVDGSGNEAEGQCVVRIDHDRRGVDATDSGDAYRIELDGEDGRLECHGGGEVPDDDAGVPGGG